MNVYMKKFGVEKPCLYEMVAVYTLLFFSYLLSDLNYKV